GGEHQVGSVRVGPGAEGLLDGRAVVRHQRARRDPVPARAGPRRDRVAGAVGALAPGPGVRDGEDGQPDRRLRHQRFTEPLVSIGFGSTCGSLSLPWMSTWMRLSTAALLPGS